jgi:hypothetical protein
MIKVCSTWGGDFEIKKATLRFTTFKWFQGFKKTKKIFHNIKEEV